MPNNIESANYPTGAVTFLFTDLEESSRLWEEYPEAMQDAMARHDAILRAGVESNQGLIVKTTGDGLHGVFSSPADALQATIDSQKAMLAADWPETGPLSVRMGMHTGQAQWREGDYYGPAVNRAARVMSVAAGGQILLSQVTTELVREQLPEELSLVDLGQQRLRSLDRPERLFQLQHPELPADFPPLASQRTTPNNLPAQLTSFIGREKETAQVKELLAPATGKDGSGSPQSANRLITLIGPGGTGKTRLSLQVAHELSSAFPDGIWLVELAPLTDPDLVVQAVAEPLGLSEQSGRSLIAMLADYLMTRKVLLILDNCEHVIDACAQLADELLRRCQQLRILASSREALGIAGERAFRVRSLSLPANGELLPVGELSKYDAIQLFMSRAKAVRSSLSLTEENAPAVLGICRRLDGIPLAIELAAARARVMAPQQILDRLDDRFRLLTGGSRTALPRQRTLQALIDWSYDLLSEPERVLLRRLSIFSGGWSLEAAESIAGSDPLEPYDVLDLMEQLHNKSLITAGEGDLHMRHAMLETVRQYAQLKLAESEEADIFRDRHLAYFIGQMDDAAEAIMNLRGTGWLEMVGADSDNFRMARNRALENDLRLALRFVANITPHWIVIFPASESLQFVDSTMRLVDSSPIFSGPEALAEDRKLVAAALASGAILALFLGSPKTSVYASRGASIAREQEDVTSLFLALIAGTARAANSGDDKTTQANLQELRRLYPRLEPPWIQAMFLAGIELLYSARSEEDVIKAMEDWELGMGFFRQSSEFWGMAYGHQMAARASYLRADYKKAEYHARRSLELYADFGDVQSVNMPRSLLADLARQRGDLDEAEPLYEEAASGWRDVAQFGALARCLECLSFIASAQAQPAAENSQSLSLTRAATLLGAAAAIRQVHHTPMTPLESAEYEKELALIKEATGDSAFQNAWQRGLAMDPDQAVAYMQGL